MGRENRFKNLQTRLNEQTNLCKLDTKRFKITPQDTQASYLNILKNGVSKYKTLYGISNRTFGAIHNSKLTE